MINHHWKNLEADKKYTNPIETLGKMLQNQPYSWRILSPDASPEELASYTRLDAAVLDYFVENAPPKKGDESSTSLLPTSDDEYREYRTADKRISLLPTHSCPAVMSHLP